MQHLTCLVDRTHALDFVSGDFDTEMGLQMRKSTTKTHVRLANGQRDTTTILAC
jgi:hypothetical protein